MNQFAVHISLHFVLLTVLDVLLPVEEPVGDLVLPGVLHDGDDLVHLLLGQLSGALLQVDVRLLQNHVGVPVDQQQAED
jgi:hypothetical protein